MGILTQHEAANEIVNLKNIHFYVKEIDIAPTGYFQVLENLKHMELVTPFGVNFFTILQPYPGEESHLDVIIRPFKLPV